MQPTQITAASALSDRIVNLTESATLRMASLSRELQQKGIDIINLSLGEPDFQTPQHIKDAAKRAIDEGYTFYTPVSGYLDLRQAIVAKFKRENGLDYTPDQIVVSTGAKQSIINVVLCMVNPGEEVVLPTPYWVSYAAMAELAEGKVVEVPTTIDTDFKMTAEQLSAVLTPQSKLLIFSSPSNPTGMVYTRDELRALAEVVAEHPNLYVVSDEIYEHINYVGHHESIGQFDFIKDRVITVNGLSKGFAMTGWRLGYIGAPLAVAKACDKMQGQYTSGTCSITQKAAIAALNESLEPTLEMREAFHRRRDLMVRLLSNIEGINVRTPQGAFYVFPDVSAFIGKTDGTTTVNDVDDISMYLLDKAHVSTVAGSSFGDSNCIRLSYATSEAKIEAACKRMKEALEQLR